MLHVLQKQLQIPKLKSVFCFFSIYFSTFLHCQFVSSEGCNNVFNVCSPSSRSYTVSFQVFSSYPKPVTTVVQEVVFQYCLFNHYTTFHFSSVFPFSSPVAFM